MNIARADLLEWLGQRPGGSDLNCLMESGKEERVCVDISFEKFGLEGQQRKMAVYEGGGHMQYGKALFRFKKK